MNTYSVLRKKIRDKSAVITVVGLGYVGLPIALEFCKKGYKVFGLDNNTRRIKKLKDGISYIDDISTEDVKKINKKKNFSATTNAGVLKLSDVIIVCVPTPLRKIKEPDISYIIDASRSMRKQMRPGQLIIVESTTYPGTTREVILPELEKSGLRLGEDFYLAFSPERIDPGNPKYSLTNIPKIIGGMDEKDTELGKFLYSRIIDKVVGVSSTEAAEVTKLLENTFRIVNIGLINEFAILCNKLGIDVWEVIRAADTKPFGFMPFYPGPGIGGHCIPADPMYLSWKARKVGFETKMIDIAAKTNRKIPNYVVKRAVNILKKGKKDVRRAKVLIIGAAYKKDVNDLRESPALDIIKDLMKRGIKVQYHDNHVPYLKIHDIKMRSRKLTVELLKKQDFVIVVTDHSYLDYKKIAGNSKLILDTRNVFWKNKIKGENIIKL
ncbi:MAG: nucleotide sugar dehydrogenase [Candidatus Omnitrophica bacterium]|nr:nucleotide sugar dehydrogenase [Candidatus Omnitrophota bacterium]